MRAKRATMKTHTCEKANPTLEGKRNGRTSGERVGKKSDEIVSIDPSSLVRGRECEKGGRRKSRTPKERRSNGKEVDDPETATLDVVAETWLTHGARHELVVTHPIDARTSIDTAMMDRTVRPSARGPTGGSPSTSPNVQQRSGRDEKANNLGKRPLSSGLHDIEEGSGEELSARNLKRPRLVWTPRLHRRFVEVVEKVGVDKAAPKTVMQMMGVSGLTRENVASHLQKYRLLLKKQIDRQAAKQSGIPEVRTPTDRDADKQPVESQALAQDECCQ